MLTTGRPCTSEAKCAPTRVADNAIAMRQKPRLLPHCDGVVCHAGWSTLRLTRTWPPGREHSARRRWHANAARADAAGLGITVEVGEIGRQLRSAVGCVLDDSSYRRAAERAQAEIKECLRQQRSLR